VLHVGPVLASDPVDQKQSSVTSVSDWTHSVPIAAPSCSTSWCRPTSTVPTGSASSGATHRAGPSPSCWSIARRIGRSERYSWGCCERPTARVLP